MAKKRIGELLLERGTISRAQLEAGLQLQKQTKQRLGITLVELGALTEQSLAQALGDSLGLPLVDLYALQPDWSAIHMLRARFCEQHALFPCGMEMARGRKQIVVAFSDPLNQPALEEIQFTTGLQVSARVAPLGAVRHAIQRHYHKVPVDQLEAPLAPEEVILEADEVSVPAPAPAGGIASDLAYLFGEGGASPDRMEELEKKFWGLLRVLQNKGLITREELARELEE